MARFSLDAGQTDAILELKLYRLARLEILVIQNELAEKRKRARQITSLLKDEEGRWKVVRDELEELMDRGLLEHVRAAGAVLEEGLRSLAARVPRIKEVRGAGLMWGLEIEGDALAVVDAARERGLLINRTSSTVLRLLPPFVVTAGEIAQGLEWLEGALARGGQGS